MGFRVEPRPVGDPQLQELLGIHKAFAVANTPEASGHAIAPGEVLPESFQYFVAVDEDDLLGCVGLVEIAPRHGEIKSMHVREAARGKGVGKTLLGAALEMARDRGFEWVSLETGRSEGFAASRRLYARAGFEECDPFGAYKADPFSYCMTRAL